MEHAEAAPSNCISCVYYDGHLFGGHAIGIWFEADKAFQGTTKD